MTSQERQYLMLAQRARGWQEREQRGDYEMPGEAPNGDIISIVALRDMGAGSWNMSGVAVSGQHVQVELFDMQLHEALVEGEALMKKLGWMQPTKH